MRRLIKLFGKLAIIVIAATVPAAMVGADNGNPVIYVVRTQDAIGPGVADNLVQVIEKANQDNVECLIVELDTPGGLAESMRDIIKAILGSNVPVVVYVAPSGARAASAGVMITMAADVAAMAPGTNIGAAHPVGAGGQEINKKMSEKVVNDMVAHAKSVAERRGRNVEWVEKAIRESVSVTEKEALEKNIIDIVAEDRQDLLRQLNGLDLSGKGTLRTTGVAVQVLEESIRTKILKTISDPNIAYILLLLGLAGLYFEFSHPGAIFPGVIGGISLILAFFGLQTLPINYAGILLILLGIVLFVLEMKITSYGLLSIGGIICLSLGSLMMFDSAESGVRISLTVLIPTVLLISGFFAAVAGLVFRAHLNRPKTGVGGMIGEIGIVKKTISPQGKVLVHGELWNARAGRTIEVGSRVRVINVENLLLEVEYLDEDPAKTPALS
jgi:membrane-bound serine protease (ClpP class)